MPSWSIRGPAVGRRQHAQSWISAILPQIATLPHGNLCKLYRCQKCLECKVFGLPPARGIHTVMPCASQPCAVPAEAAEALFHHVTRMIDTSCRRDDHGDGDQVFDDAEGCEDRYNGWMSARRVSWDCGWPGGGRRGVERALGGHSGAASIKSVSDTLYPYEG